MTITYSIFPKFQNGLSIGELADLVNELELGACNAVIREGYWTPPEQISATLPAFVRRMEEEGLSVFVATTSWNPGDIVKDPDILSRLMDGGITEVRLSALFSGGGYGRTGDVRGELDRAKKLFERTDALARRTGVRCIYQVHHQTLLPSASSIWPLIRSCSPEGLGVMLDGGNQPIDGYENWRRSARLLGRHLTAFGVKDACPLRDPGRAGEADKGWSWSIAPCFEGITNWHEVKEALSDIEFEGLFVFMPFYHRDDFPRFKKTLKEEVEYIKKVFEQ